MNEFQLWLQRVEEYLDFRRRPGPDGGREETTIGKRESLLKRWITFALENGHHPSGESAIAVSEFLDVLDSLRDRMPRTRGDDQGRIEAWRDWCRSQGFSEVSNCWLVRAGSESEAVDHNLVNDVVSIGYGYQGDLGSLAIHASTRSELGDRIDEQFGDLSEGRRRRARDEVWRFVREIQFGDLVVMPMKDEGTEGKPIAIGHIDGPYEFDPEQSEQVRCRRPVTWLRTGIERSAIGEDLRTSLNARFTVLELHHHDAAQRIHHLARHGFDPALRDAETPVGQHQSAQLAQLVAEFRAAGYPSDEDSEHEKTRAEHERTLISLADLAFEDRDKLKRVWANTRRNYGSSGNQQVLHKAINDADLAGWSNVRDSLLELCFGDAEVEHRIDEAVEQVFGLGPLVATRLLAICHSDEFIPIYVLRSNSRYPGKLDMIETLDERGLLGESGEQRAQETLELHLEVGDSGEVVVRSNDLLLETLRPYFMEDGFVDSWGISRFLYWLASEPHDGEMDEPWIDEGDLAVLAEELLCDVGFLKDVVALLEDKKQVILYGPPGTGKTFFAQELARELTRYGDTEERPGYSLVQFHQAYSYEDFFEGFRPQVDDKGQMTYQLMPGPLVQLAERAQEHLDELHVMVIDEINRANLPRVLGELLYLLEYRNESVQTQYRPDGEFSLPENLWFIGTMNTADRSIALIDAAMRRRFHFVPFFPDREPTTGLLRRWCEENEQETWIADRLDDVNERLRGDLGSDHMLIGPSHFMREDLDEDGLRRIWEYNIEPLIEDQFFGRQEVIDSYRFHEVWKHHGPDAAPPDAGPGTPDGPVDGDESQSTRDEGTESYGDD